MRLKPAAIAARESFEPSTVAPACCSSTTVHGLQTQANRRPSGRHFACKSTDTSQLHGAQAINNPHTQRTAGTQSAAGTSQTDQVDISPQAQLADQVNNIPDIRADRVATIKAAIADGTYETAGQARAPRSIGCWMRLVKGRLQVGSRPARMAAWTPLLVRTAAPAWLIVALVLAFVAGLAGYELNWIHQRRALLAESEAADKIVFLDYSVVKDETSGSAASRSIEVVSPDIDYALLQPVGSKMLQRLLGWLGEPAAEQVTVYCLIDEAPPHDNVMPDGTPVASYVDKIPKIIRARELFPEAGINVRLVKRGLVVPSTGLRDPALEEAISP